MPPRSEWRQTESHYRSTCAPLQPHQMVNMPTSRLELCAAFVCASSLLMPSASAQSIVEIKSVRFGTGCLEMTYPAATRLGACKLGESSTRIWCPNGKIFDRKGALPANAVLRSICGLNQVP